MEIVIALLLINILLLSALLIRANASQKETKWQLAKVMVSLNWHEQLLKSVFATTQGAEEYYRKTFLANNSANPSDQE